MLTLQLISLNSAVLLAVLRLVLVLPWRTKAHSVRYAGVSTQKANMYRRVSVSALGWIAPLFRAFRRLGLHLRYTCQPALSRQHCASRLLVEQNPVKDLSRFWSLTLGCSVCVLISSEPSLDANNPPSVSLYFPAHFVVC